MFDRFTDAAKQTMNLARQAAQRMNHEYLGTEHILLGLLEMPNSASKVLTALEIDPEALTNDVRAAVHPGPSMFSIGQLPFTPRAKRVLELAMEHASRLEDDFIGTEHLLLGLIDEGEGVAGKVLAARGVDSTDTVRKVIELRGQDPDAAKGYERASRGAHMVDEVGLALYHVLQVVEHARQRRTGDRRSGILDELRHELASQLERWTAARRADEDEGD